MNTNKPVAWAWRFPDGRLSPMFATRKDCASLHIGYEGQPVPLVVMEAPPEAAPRQPLTDEQMYAVILSAKQVPRNFAGWVREQQIVFGRAVEAAHGIGVPPTAGEPVADWEALRHSANEWADMATNGLQWLRNIVDGISNPKEALENMEVNFVHCQRINDRPEVQSSIRCRNSGIGVPTRLPADDTEGGEA